MAIMSFFYLSPVKGDITVHLLETIVTKRLEFLKAVYNNQPKVYNEYVIEGSLYDVIGHFMLCIICSIGGTRDFIHFFIESEEKLFSQRINTLSAYELRRFAKHLLRTIRKLEIESNFIKPLRILCQHLNIQSIAQHMTTTCCQNCLFYNIKINFKHCLKLVAKRHVELNCGTALIPCKYWKLYLTQLFSMSLKQKICKPDIETLRNDPRIIEIYNKIKKENMVVFRNEHEVVILKNMEVDNKSQFFPPCMVNLHQHLRRKHRLKHDQRFCYSLFLKDLGMPIEEAIIFWRSEYEKVPNGHSCCHTWEKDENKFIYSIRHLYGLEGGKKNYMSRNCQQIQNYDSSRSEGGCPFKSFDDDKMFELLYIKQSDPILSQLKQLQFQGNYTLACKMYLQNNYCVNKCDNLSYNFNPVKFYFEAVENKVE